MGKDSLVMFAIGVGYVRMIIQSFSNFCYILDYVLKWVKDEKSIMAKNRFPKSIYLDLEKKTSIMESIYISKYNSQSQSNLEQ